MSNGDPAGLLYLLTGDGKGKTSAACGLAVRAAGAGRRVAIVCFDKGGDLANEGKSYCERVLLRATPGVEIFPFGRDRMGGERFDFTNCDEDYAQARAALDKARALMAEGTWDMLICDELLTAACVSGLLERGDVLALVKDFNGAGRPCDLVMTGRGAQEWRELIDGADIVSEVRCIKHCFDRGIAARRGFDY